MKRFSECQLYAFVDTAYLAGRDPVELTRELCDGGADLIQLRAKGATVAEVRRLADALLPVTARAEVGLIINDHADVARAVRAFGCHLGQEDFFDAGFTRASDVVGSEKAVGLGLSTHSPNQALRAIMAEPDYVAIGPIYPTPTKPGRAGVTLDYVRWASTHIGIPWFAIGGITLRNVDLVLAAGARRIAVVSAILNAPDVAEACQSFRMRLTSAPLD